ncbi:MAG: amidohydrolase family protein [Acidimicrobiia bacterium]|nr:amidohydrolase family protein [Acidimicrobiia bacterium]
MSEQVDLAIVNGQVTISGLGTFRGAIGVKDERVAWISESGESPNAREVVDAESLHVLPGIVDGHSHYGLGNDDDFKTESRSAVMAGITSTVSYLMQQGDDYTEIFNDYVQTGERDSYIDFGFHFGVSSVEQSEKLTLAKEQFGVVSHKYFMSFKRGGEGSYIGVNDGHDGVLYKIMQQAAQDPDVTIVVHSENIEVVWTLAEELKARGVDGLAAWDESRPDFTEADDIATVGLFGKVTGARVFIPHVSSAMGMDVVRSMGADRPLIETCPHFLTHTKDEAFGSLGKVNPPLRSASDVDAVWEAVLDGTVDVIGSDHNSRPRSKKSGDIWSSSAGFPGQGTMLPAVLTEGRERGLSLERTVELMAAKPAQIFGRYPQKGTLRPGSDADIVLVDMETPRQVDTSTWGSFSDYSLDEGIDLIGWPVATYVRGSLAWSLDDGWAPEPTGKHVPGA